MKKTLVMVAALALAGCGMGLPDAGGGAEGPNQCEAPASVLNGWGLFQTLPPLSVDASVVARRYVVYFQNADAAGPGTSVQRLWRDGRAGLTDADVADVQRAGGRVALKLRAQRAVAAELDAEALAKVKASPRVRKVELDPTRSLKALAPQSMPWGISALGAPEAWAQSPGLAKGAKVCVIDSGVFASHVDLQLDASGTPGDWQDDRCGHGTHVAGTIAALDNSEGVVGVNPRGVDLFGVKVFGEDCGWTYASALADAVQACVSNGARVVNMSLGGLGASEAEAQAFADAWNQGVLLVAASGNEGSDTLEYPASYPSVISVGAVDENGDVAEFSQHNGRVDLVAPGVHVESTVPFVSRHLVTVDGREYVAGPLENAAETSGSSGALADGGMCSEAGRWQGKVVLCKRGGTTFAEKVAVAKRGGAVAAIIFNDSAGSFAGTLGEAPADLPAIAVSGTDGDALLKFVGHTAQVVNEPRKQGSGYASFSGTSMASPHVAGAAALLFGQEPQSTNAQVREALEGTARDLGLPGRDDDSGFGLVRVDQALQRLRTHPAAVNAPRAGFVAECDGLTCAFTDVSLNAGTSGRTFDFGDGTYGTASGGSVRLEHTFDRPGPYTVQVTVAGATLKAPISVVALEVSGGPREKDGSRKVALSWSGAAGPNVLLVRDGEVLGQTENSGGGTDVVKDGGKTVRYRVCDAGGDSCSAEVSVLPECG